MSRSCFLRCFAWLLSRKFNVSVVFGKSKQQMLVLQCHLLLVEWGYSASRFHVSKSILALYFTKQEKNKLIPEDLKKIRVVRTWWPPKMKRTKKRKPWWPGSRVLEPWERKLRFYRNPGSKYPHPHLARRAKSPRLTREVQGRWQSSIERERRDWTKIGNIICKLCKP